MKVLDLSAGNRAVWFDKAHPCATYLDIRPEVKPDIVADSRALPADLAEDYDLVVFDPPHKNNAATGNMVRSYGHWTAQQIREIVAETAKEAHRVVKDDGLMAFKWNEHSRTLADILGLLAPYWEPLFGHGVTHQQRGTSWVMLRRIDCFNPRPASPVPRQERLPETGGRR